jgi:sugar (pentulose or hexulose) kinase
MLAAVGTGTFKNTEDARDAWLTDLKSVIPNTAQSAAYDDAYGRYQALYPALKGMFESGSVDG